MTKNKCCDFVLSFIFLVFLGAFTSVAAQSKFDEYGEIRTKDENVRLDNLVVEMKNDPNMTAYIIAYGGRRSSPKDAQKRADKAKKYSSKKGKIDPSRIIVIDGGYKESPTTELWTVPAGGDPPSPSPSVDPSEVMPPKSTKKTKSKSLKS